MNIFLPDPADSSDIGDVDIDTSIEIDAVPDEQAYADLAQNNYNLKETFYFTRAAIVTTTVTGSISAICSAIVIYVICKSASKLTSSYHRIMFFMSLWDIVASIAMALTTTPMPTDMIYPFEGRSYGTKHTCRAQGALYLVGSACVMNANIALFTYYLATIRYKVKDEIVKNKVLPYFFALAIIIPVSIIVSYILSDQINPFPYDSFCTVASYPSCGFVLDNASCEMAIVGPSFFSMISALAIFGGLVTLVVTMVMIVITVYQNERDLITATKERNEDLPADAGSHARINELKMTRSIGIQAFCYFVAFILSWIFGVIEMIRGIPSIGHPDGAYNSVAALRLVFQPLQGFFSALIFVSHKVLLCRRSQDMSFTQAMSTIFFNPGSVPEILVSQMIIVAEDDFEKEFRERDIEWRRRQNNSSNPSSILDDRLSYSQDDNHPSLQHSSVFYGSRSNISSHSNISSQGDLSGFDLSSIGSGHKGQNEDISMPSLAPRDMNASLSVIEESWDESG